MSCRASIQHVRAVTRLTHGARLTGAAEQTGGSGRAVTALSNIQHGGEQPADDDYGSMPVTEFDRAEAADAAAELLPCCASRRWVSELVTGRPYHSLSGLAARSDAVLAELDWPDVVQALDPATGRDAGHPGDGGRRASTAGAEDGSDPLTEARRRYERKFGYRFVICAAGLSPEQVLAAAIQRLANDPFVERAVAAGELTKVVRQRLATAFH